MIRDCAPISVTTKDDLYHVGLTGNLSCVISSSKPWPPHASQSFQATIMGCISMAKEPFCSNSPFFYVFPTALTLQAI